MSIRTLKRLRRNTPAPRDDAAHRTYNAHPFTAKLYLQYRSATFVVVLGKRQMSKRVILPRPDLHMFLHKLARHMARKLLEERTSKPIRNRHLPYFDIRN